MEAIQRQEMERTKADARRLECLFNLSEHPVWQRDNQLNVTYCNMAFSEVADPGNEEMLEVAGLELFKGHHELARKALESGQEQTVDRHIVVDGKRRLYRIREVPSPTDQTVCGYATDVTAEEDARREVERHISGQRDLLESSTSATAIFGADTKLKFYNFAFVALWRLDESWLDSEPTYSAILEALREKRSLPEQANFVAFKQQHLKLFTDLMEPHEEFFYLPDGRILRVLAIPHALGGLVFAYEDVTDRLALERSYNTLIAVQRETLDNLHEAVVVIGEDGRVKLSNPTYGQMWEQDERFMNSEPHVREVLDVCRDYFAVEDWEEFRERFIAQFQQRKVQHGHLERANKTVLQWRSVPLPDGGTLLTYTDITDSILVERSLRETNEALEAADRLKTEFLANMSYELRSPLTSISGFSDILRHEYFGELTDKQREYVEGICQSSQHLSQLISNILDLASIEAGYMQLDISDVDVERMMESLLMLMKERVKAMDITVTTHCDESVRTLRADESRIKQILFNLLSNALQYSHAGSNIEMSVRAAEEGGVLLSVTDHGVGIEPDKQHLVFDKFYHDGAASGQQAGSGLGLSIVKNFVELHGGAVSLASTPGKGTQVTCHIPQIA